MKHSDDIVNLFQQFGAKADPYHELARKQEHQLSNERWPLVSAVRNAVADDVPSVDRSAGTAAARFPSRLRPPFRRDQSPLWQCSALHPSPPSCPARWPRPQQ